MDARSLYFYWWFDGEKQQNIAMVFNGLSIHIARFHSQSRTGGGGGAYLRVKNTCAGTLAENGRGAYMREVHYGSILYASTAFHERLFSPNSLPWQCYRSVYYSYIFQCPLLGLFSYHGPSPLYGLIIELLPLTNEVT